MARIQLLNEVGATVIINGAERESVTVDSGSIVDWSVSKEGYAPQSGFQTVDEDTVLKVRLVRESQPTVYYELVVNATPTASLVTVTWDGEVATGTGSISCMIEEGLTVTVDVSCDGYLPESRTLVMDSDKELSITLEEEKAVSDRSAVRFSLLPVDCWLGLEGVDAVTGETIDDAADVLPVDATTGRAYYDTSFGTGTVIEWTATCSGYVTQTGSVTCSEPDMTVMIDLVEDEGSKLTLTPSSAHLGWDGGLCTFTWRHSGKEVDYITADTTLGEINGYDDTGGGDVNVWLDPNLSTIEKSGTVRICGFVDNEEVASASASITQGAQDTDYPATINFVGASSMNIDSYAESGTRETTFQIETSADCDGAYIDFEPAYGKHNDLSYEYGIQSLTVNGVTLESYRKVSLEEKKTYTCTIRWVNYHTSLQGSPNTVTNAYYGFEGSVLFYGTYGNFRQSSASEFSIYTSNAGSGPVDI